MIERLLAVLEHRVAGASLSELSEGLGETEDRVATAIACGVEDGLLERWPFWPERIRATARVATPFLQDLARLRSQAWPFLQRISHTSGWPATLHLLVPGAHAVVERFPWRGDADEIAREQSRYATPRSLRSGATAMTIVANLPDATRAAVHNRWYLKDLAPKLADIRARGYCLSRGVDVSGGWILSAPLRAIDGAPYGALCTYGVADELEDAFVEKATQTAAICAMELSHAAQPGAVAQRARAIIAEMTEPGR